MTKKQLELRLQIATDFIVYSSRCLFEEAHLIDETEYKYTYCDTFDIGLDGCRKCVENWFTIREKERMGNED